MNLFLAIMGAVVGLFVTGAGIYTAWTVHQLWRQQAASPRAVSQAQIAVTYFSRWTIIDYSVVGLFIIGLLLMIAELVAVGRDHTEIANFHWGVFAYRYYHFRDGNAAIVYSFDCRAQLPSRECPTTYFGGYARSSTRAKRH